MATDLGKRCDFHNAWTLRDGFQTLPSDASSPTAVADLVEAYRAGATISQLAIEFGVHRATVAGHLDRRQVPRHRERTAWESGTLEEAAELNASGRSLADVADRFGIDAQTAANRFRRAGVAVRPRGGRASALA